MRITVDFVNISYANLKEMVASHEPALLWIRT